MGIPTSDQIQDYINSNVPVNEFSVDPDSGKITVTSPSFLNEVFYNFLNTMFNEDIVITEDIENTNNFFNPFSPYVSINFPIYDDRLSQIDQIAINFQLAYSINDLSYNFICLYLSSIFPGIEMYYYDTISELLVPIVSNGTVPPSGSPTVSLAQFLQGQYSPYIELGSVVEGLYSYYAKIYFNVFSLSDTFIPEADSAFKVVQIIKPGRVFFFYQPCFLINVSQTMNDGNPYYDSDIFDYLTLDVDLSVSAPSALFTDQGDSTDWTPELYTDSNDQLALIEVLNVIQVQYADNPNVWVIVPSTVYVDTVVYGSDTYNLVRWTLFVTGNVLRVSLGNADTVYWQVTLKDTNNFVESLTPTSLNANAGSMEMNLFMLVKNGIY